MGCAAYREHPGTVRSGHRTVFGVLDVIVPCAHAGAVRRCLAGCDGAGVLRCEPLLHQGAATTADCYEICS